MRCEKIIKKPKGVTKSNVKISKQSMVIGYYYRTYR